MSSSQSLVLPSELHDGSSPCVNDILEEGATKGGLPQQCRCTVIAACVVMFAEGYHATMNFPFASFMVQNLRGTDTYLGLTTGVYFAAFPVGSFLTARLWASQANFRGRKICLLMSLGSSSCLTLLIAICPSYEAVVFLRFMQGLTNCSLPMTRTCLRERVQQLNGDEVRAFSLMQAAFALSSVAGPAAGGLLYGWPHAKGLFSPWSPPYIVAFCLYIFAIVVSCFFMKETFDLDVPHDLRVERSRSVALFRDPSIIHFLVMVAGHSYVFTGWEVCYPLFARSSAVEDWSSGRIGITFLIGSLGLLFHTLCTYPVMVKKMGLLSIWMWSWIACIMTLSLFPRALNILTSLGFDGKGWIIIVVNYLSQLFISVLQGCNFTTLQLILNELICARDDSEFSLPIANGWMVSLQALARSSSAVMTASLVTVSSPCEGALAFDVLAGIALAACLLFGYILRKRQKQVSLKVKVETFFKEDIEFATSRTAIDGVDKLIGA